MINSILITNRNRLSRIGRTCLTELSRIGRMCLILCVLFATNNEAWAQSWSGIGAGTEANPYRIRTSNELSEFRTHINNGSFSTAHWRLENDIEWANPGVIGRRIDGVVRYFEGTFDGNGHIISFSNIDEASETVGFFGEVRRCTIKNFTIQAGYISGNRNVGGLVGIAHEGTNIEGVHVRLTGTSIMRGANWGGLIGMIWGTGTININFCSVVISSVNFNNENYGFGGLIGVADSQSNGGTINITDCLTDVNFTLATNQTGIGGLIGCMFARKTINVRRAVVNSTGINDLGSNRERGAIVGTVRAGSTLNLRAVYHNLQTDIFAGRADGTVNRTNVKIVNSWNGNAEVYYELERRNNDGNPISEGTQGNRRWGYDNASRPMLTQTNYAVRVVRGSNVGSIENVRHCSGDNCYANVNETLTVIASPHASGQRAEFRFILNYGTTNDFNTIRDGKNWLLSPRVSGVVSATFVNVPYPMYVIAYKTSETANNFEVRWSYSNPNNLAGRFFVYRREGTTGAWGNNIEYIDAGNTGNNIVNVSVNNMISADDFNKSFQYLIVFVEGYDPPLDPENEVEIPFRAITSNLILVAHAVTFNSRGGSPVSSATVPLGDLLPRPAAPARSGFIFAGWYMEEACINAWQFDTDVVTGDMTLFARWLDAAPVIAIDTQPAANINVTEGGISGGLSVSASATQGATISYQWFSATTNSNAGGDAINSATAASFTIPVTLTAGTYYYFCEVRADGANSVRTDVATVTVAASAVPVIFITAQPDASLEGFNEGNISGSLAIEAFATQDALVTYQWYSATSNSADDGVAISGATSSSFNIPVALTAGTYYYFCEVRAIDAVSVRSDVARVTVSPEGAPVIITINLEGGIVGVDYTAILLAIGALPVSSWTATGDLPNGLTLASATGIISGVPANAGTFNFSISASNDNGYTDLDVSIVIAKGRGDELDVSPTVQNVTHNSITVNAIPPPGNGQTVEYAIRAGVITTEPTTGWQSGTTFTGLREDDLYQVFARTAENDDYLAGAATVPIQIMTNLATSIPEMLSANPLKAWIRDGLLRVEGLVAGSVWNVYSINGALAYTGIASGNEAVVALTVAGVYIVQSGENAVRVVFE